MIRTRFYNRHNVLSLRVERKRIRLLKRKAERDQAKAERERVKEPRHYLIGLMIRMNQAYLTKADMKLCDRLYELEPGDNATRGDMMELHKLIGRLMYDPKAVMIYSAHPDEIDDGGSAILRKAG